MELRDLAWAKVADERPPGCAAGAERRGQSDADGAVRWLRPRPTGEQAARTGTHG
ncbi:hypothetical protein [Actinokineospora enzanensis]|uniref:hypothetical protein n=1 Tax=Actinokineospora enzanensis TaxID=155975 RepID=UPI00039A36E0|nr:hypothetical protein [Actinokineospora enzanensis]